MKLLRILTALIVTIGYTSYQYKQEQSCDRKYNRIITKMSRDFKNKYSLNVSSLSMRRNPKNTDEHIWTFGFARLGPIDRKDAEKLLIYVYLNALQIINSLRKFGDKIYPYPESLAGIDIELHFNRKNGFGVSFPDITYLRTLNNEAFFNYSPMGSYDYLEFNDSLSNIYNSQRNELPHQLRILGDETFAECNLSDVKK